jgi:hypothetical protein
MSNPRDSLPPIELSDKKAGEIIILSAEYCRYKNGRHFKQALFTIAENKKTKELFVGPMCTKCNEMFDKANDAEIRSLGYHGQGHGHVGVALLSI